jgi:hypothetical protein
MRKEWSIIWEKKGRQRELILSWIDMDLSDKDIS